MTNLSLKDFIAPASKILAGISTALAVLLAGFTVYRLFHEFAHFGPVQSALNAFASVGLFVLFVGITTSHDNTAVRGMAALFALLFGGLSLCLVALGGALTAALFDVPAQLTGIGQIAGALLPAISVIAVVSLWPAHRNPPDRFSSIGAAVGHYLENAAKLTAILASMGFGFYFGVLHGVPPLIAALACGILELLFVASYNNTQHAHEHRDAFDVVMWSICTAATGAFIALVSIESMSSVAGIDIMPESLRNAGKTIFVSSVGIAVALFVVTGILTRLIDIPMAARAHGVGIGRVMVRRPGTGWAIDRTERAALPAGAVMAKDSPIKGIDYDATAAFTVAPDQEITKPLGDVARAARAGVGQQPEGGSDPKAAAIPRRPG